MATATVTGSLKDLGLVSMGDRVPELVFELDEDLVILGSSTLIPAEPVKVIPASNGSFTVALQESLGTNPYSPYKLTINWSSNGIPRTVSPSWRIVVPAGGGAIGNMIAAVTPSQIITKGAPGDAAPLTIVQAVAASAGRPVIVNPIPNSAPSEGSPAWPRNYGTGGAGDADFVVDTSAPSKKGYVRMTWTTAPTAVGGRIQSPNFAVSPGQMWSGGIWVRSSIANVLGAAMYFYDGAGAQVGSTLYHRLYRVAAGEWTRLELNGFDAPTGAVTARLGAAVNGTLGSLYGVGSYLDASAVAAFEGSTVYPWFDGDTVNAYWTGLENASPAVTSLSGEAFAGPFTNAPSAAGVRAGRYSTEYRMYLPPGADIGPMRRRIASALGGQTTYRLGGMGHSIVAGQGGTPGVIDSIRLLQLRAAQAGKAVTGLVTGSNNTTRDARVTKDPGWFASGGPRDNMQLHISSTSVGENWTVAFDHAGTVVDIYTFGNGSAVTYSIDGAAPVTITPSGVPEAQITTVTGLGNTTHTVTITSTSASVAYLLGVGLHNTSGLEVSNFGYSGSIASDWRPTALGSGSFYNGFSSVVKAWDSNGVIIELGANEIIWSVGPESLALYLGQMIEKLLEYGNDVVLVVDPPVYSATRTTWFRDFYPVLYDVADLYRVPLLDFTAHWINRGVADARGLLFDWVHPNNEGYFDLHGVLTKALLP